MSKSLILPAGIRSVQVRTERSRLLLPERFREHPPIAGGAARTYMVYNGAMPTTAAAAKVATGTALKTLLQVQTGSVAGIRVIEWGVSFDASAAATPIQCELITTASIAATVTAYVAQDIIKMNGPNDAASSVTLGASASGYTSTSEGSVTSTRPGDVQQVAPTNQYLKQFPLGREFEVPVSTNLRVRVTAGASVGAYAYVVWEE